VKGPACSLTAAGCRAAPTATSDGVSGPDGSSATQLIDETEESNWRANGPVEGQQVTVDLLAAPASSARST